MEDKATQEAGVFKRVIGTGLSALYWIGATALLVLMVKGCIYIVAFQISATNHLDKLRDGNLRAIASLTDPIAAAQLSAVEDRMGSCRRTAIAVDVPMLDFWIEEAQVMGSLRNAEVSCTTKLLDQHILTAPRATMALAAEMHGIGYPLSTAYEQGARRDAIALASVNVRAPIAD